MKVGRQWILFAAAIFIRVTQVSDQITLPHLT
jgi:hypothetical protein